jgi:STELLO glycosyltransferases
MTPSTALVVTSIAAPNQVLRELAVGAAACGSVFFVIGDVASPAGFQLDGCEFFDLLRQEQTGLRTAALCPTRHYARKNIGYLLAVKTGAQIVIETDDDNVPASGFWGPRSRGQRVVSIRHAGWVNAYSYFSDTNIWPRGLPLDEIQSNSPAFDSLQVQEADCPIQQGLADGDPDVDALYRFIFPVSIRFRTDRRLALGERAWCPFNSQNTSWWPDAYELMYLPGFCSFRMTDIWRSFIAQRIAWANGWCVLFHEPTMFQMRNQHNPMRDFRDEIPGYLNNRRIAETLEGLNLASGVENIGANLRLCYESLVRIAILETRELDLLEAWIEDFAAIRKSQPTSTRVMLKQI